MSDRAPRATTGAGPRLVRRGVERLRALGDGMLRARRAESLAAPRYAKLRHETAEETVARLRSRGIAVEELPIALRALDAFRARWDYADYHYGSPADSGQRRTTWEEKSLEHFLSVELLGLGPSDVLVDVASSHSNFAANARKVTGCKAYGQDLVFPEGLHGDLIGGDATHMPVEPGFATKISLHCSFEHFEGDGDGAFVDEAARVLAPGGRLCVIPLYVGLMHAIGTDPRAWEPSIPLDEGAAWYFFGKERFQRWYSVEALDTRVMKRLAPAFDAKVVWFSDRKRLFPSLWCDFALVATRK